MILSKRAAGFVNGSKGRVLRTIEELTGTFCFIGRSTGADSRPLFVCGSEVGRNAAIHVLEKYVQQYQANDWLDDANEASSSAEMSKASLEHLLKSKGLYAKPLQPWEIQDDDTTAYSWLCQPCPGAARMDTVVLPVNDKSSVLMRSNSGLKKERSPKNTSEEFLNDASSFPELGNKRPSIGSNTTPSRPPPAPASPRVAPISPTARQVIPDEARDSGIFIDREKKQVWGDWGYGPNGDPEIVSGSVKSLASPKLLGAWK
jgi:hypothetical protein